MTFGPVAAIARRELGAYLRAPAFYAIAALFLAVQGYSFSLFVTLLNGRTAPLGALRFLFGGSLLFWLFVMLVAALATMRLLAEERRSGTLEPLLTAPVSPGEVVVGKYLASLGFYALLWAPTLAWVVLLARYAPAGAPIDPGPILGGYLGTLLVGASALAIGLAASSITAHQLVAAAVAFLATTALLLASLGAEAASPEGALRPLLARLDLLRQMDDFGRGLVDLRAVVLHLSIVGCALFASARALALPSAGRPRTRFAVELLLLVAIAGAANVAVARHPVRFDLTRGRANTLAPRTESLLARVTLPVEVTLLMLPTGGPADPYPETRDLLDQLAARQPLLHVDRIGEGDGDRVRALAEHYHLSPDDLAAGAVVFASGGRSRFVGRPELARFEDDPDTGPRIAAFTGEQAFGGAIAALVDDRPIAVCFTQGHGEAAIDSLAVDGMSDLGDALRRADATLRTLPALDAGVPESCDVTVIAGPERPFSGAEVAALDAAHARGQRLLVLLGPTFDPGLTRLEHVGLEAWLERAGAAPRDSIALDPELLSRRELAWAVDAGYADHPITSSFAGRRTVWSMARPIEPVAGPDRRATALVSTGERGWGEADLVSVVRERARLAFDPAVDTRGPIAVAVAVEETTGPSAGPRLVVIGSRAIARNDHDVSYNRDLLVSAVEWLGRRAPPAGIGPATPAQLRLRLDDDELRRVFLVSVVGLPLLPLLLGAAVWWRRRR